MLKIIRQHRAVRRNHGLFHAGESLRSLYILRSGSAKSWNVTEEGEEHIIRFHFPGDVLGLGAISSGFYDCNATTLDTCSVCELPFKHFQRLAEELPDLNYQLLKLMSREIAQEEQRVFLRANRSAPVRLASFLNCLSRSFGERGFSTREFNLTMGRKEIANYLGLALETVSRTFSQFQDEGVLRVEGKRVCVTNKARLTQLSSKYIDFDGSACPPRWACH
ncbi:MAG: cyclic nucleotide-binding domain-containing protein [Pseudomonadota bacterium]